MFGDIEKSKTNYTNNNKKDLSLLETGIGCITMGAIGSSWLGMTGFIPPLFYVSGVGLFVWHIVEGSNKYTKLWEALEIKCKPHLREKIKTNYGYCLRFNVPTGMCVSDFAKKKEPIHQHLDSIGICNRLQINYKKGGNMLFQVYEKELKNSYNYEEYADIIKAKGLDIPLGFTYGEKLVKVNLKSAVHILIAGETDSGKSTLLRLMITLMLTELDIDLYLCDLKFGTEFQIFKEHPNVKQWIRKKKDALSMLNRVYGEVARRNELFYKTKVRDIEQYNKKYPKKKLRHEVVFIDELAMLRKKDTKDSIKIIEDLAGLARSSGIHLVCATQKPSIKENVITTIMKGNFPTTIGLRTHGKTESLQILDETGLEELRGYGHGVLKLKGQKTEFQTINLEHEVAMRMVDKDKNKDKKSKPTKKVKATFKKCRFGKNNKTNNKIDNKNTPKQIDISNETGVNKESKAKTFFEE